MSNSSTSGKMYFVTASVIPQENGVDVPKLSQRVLNVLSELAGGTKVIHKFKVCGEPRYVLVLQVLNLANLENTVGSLCGLGPLQVDCLPTLSYESFARSIKVDEDLAQPSAGSLGQEGLYWLEFDVDYHGKSTDKLIKIWRKEAEAVFTARHYKGTSIELYKCVAQRKVHAFMNAANPEQLDALSMQLPLMQKNGANVQIKCRALQFLDDYSASSSRETL